MPPLGATLVTTVKTLYEKASKEITTVELRNL
jgi:hypothetical protein